MNKKKALETFISGENFHLQHYLGAHREEKDGEYGYAFRVWAPVSYTHLTLPTICSV